MSARPQIEPLFVSVAEMARLLSISRAHAYRLLDQHAVESRWLGTRRVIPLASVYAYANGLPRERAS